MGAETANIVLVVIIVIIFFMLMSACCRQLRQAYDEQTALQAMQRQRRQRNFFLEGVDLEGIQEEETRSVRVTAISAGGGDRVFGVYEIRMPRRGRSLFSRVTGQPPPPPFSTAIQNSSPIYYIDSEEPPPSYDDYMKTVPTTSKDEEEAQGRKY